MAGPAQGRALSAIVGISDLQSVQRIEVERMLAIRERVSGSGANQIGNLQSVGATRWSSHYDSIKNLIDMLQQLAKCLSIFKNIAQKASSQVEVHGVYRHFACLDFGSCLLLMHKVIGITSILCQGIQKNHWIS
ncbi:unnamed protein product [Cuscuta epithymum]|uniref:Uncharacterized protein n=1 Tax=Cuscuta epithymum TaxID=186058 RepID=A0AAV0DM14_9ASTE|nr:unnamed protein product [Cuscuta epithymum]